MANELPKRWKEHIKKMVSHSKMALHLKYELESYLVQKGISILDYVKVENEECKIYSLEKLIQETMESTFDYEHLTEILEQELEIITNPIAQNQNRTLVSANAILINNIKDAIVETIELNNSIHKVFPMEKKFMRKPIQHMLKAIYSLFEVPFEYSDSLKSAVEPFIDDKITIDMFIFKMNEYREKYVNSE